MSSTFAIVGAARRVARLTARMAGPDPTMSGSGASRGSDGGGMRTIYELGVSNSDPIAERRTQGRDTRRCHVVPNQAQPLKPRKAFSQHDRRLGADVVVVQI